MIKSPSLTFVEDDGPISPPQQIISAFVFASFLELLSEETRNKLEQCDVGVWRIKGQEILNLDVPANSVLLTVTYTHQGTQRFAQAVLWAENPYSYSSCHVSPSRNIGSGDLMSVASAIGAELCKEIDTKIKA